MKYTVGITGGIGSGKSIVARYCRCRGIDVYDCDMEAKLLMDCSNHIKKQIKEYIDESCVGADGIIDRKRLSKIVFCDHKKLSILNRTVHEAVREHFCQWREKCNADIVMVETAIPMSSGMYNFMDSIWIVEAPIEVRTKRVRLRNGLTKDEVKRIIDAQKSESIDLPSHKIQHITNDDNSSIIRQIDKLLNEIITQNVKKTC